MYVTFIIEPVQINGGGGGRKGAFLSKKGKIGRFKWEK